MFQGEIAAIAAAFAWAMATLLYGRFSHSFNALEMNIVKGVVASAMMTVVLPVLPVPSYHLDTHHFVILAFSGVIGIAIGDSAYFSALKRIGPSKTLLLESLAPPLSGVLAVMALGTALSLQSWFGVIITTLAVMFVVFQPQQGEYTSSWSGLGFGMLASTCQASGVVISHYALVAGDIAPLLGALVRLAVGVSAVCLLACWLDRKALIHLWQKLRRCEARALVWFLVAIFVGTFLALWLQQVALKYANPAIAQTLIATSPVFVLLVALLRGEKVALRSAIGTLLAMVGVSLFFWQ